MKRSAREKLGLGLAALAVPVVFLLGCSPDEQSREEGRDRDASRAVDRGSPGGSPAHSERIWPVAPVAAEVEPSVVQVNVESIVRTPFGFPRQRQGLGSGVIYRENGYIITNAHVVRAADEVNVAFADGTTERAQVVGTDPFTDIAVVKVDREGLPAAEFASGGNLRLGELAVALGSPSGFESTVTAGVISGLGREFPPALTGGQPIPSLVGLIQTDAAISPGSSGGALANRSGEVIGINVAYLPPQTGAVAIGFAIPAETATSVATQLIETGEAVHPSLGVSVTTLTPTIAEQFGFPVEEGALVVGINPDGPAAQAGLEPRSVITAIGPEKVESAGDLLDALRQHRPGETVEVTVVRDDQKRELEVELGGRS